MASQSLSDHNFIDTLRMLNKNAVLNGNAEESYMLYAETFDDMDLHEKCANGWFKYLDYAFDNADLAEAYEGLAVAYMNMNDDEMGAYYYEKLLTETAQELSDQEKKDIISSFIKPEKTPLKLVYPPEMADYSEEIDGGISRMRRNDYEGAIEEFDKVDEGNDRYFSARNYIAMCKIIIDKCDEAEQECQAILKREPQNVQALATLSAVKVQQSKVEESKELAKRLLEIEVENPEELYKIATVCCENGLHEEAYGLFCKLEEEIAYDNVMLYFKAVSAYLSGRKQESLEAFDKLLTIYPDAVTARYYYEQVKSAVAENKETDVELTYFYRLPQEQRENNFQFLSALSRLSKKNTTILLDEIDASDCIKWCFDEGEGRNNVELQILGAACAIKSDMDDLVRDILLNINVNDIVKMSIISELVLKNVASVYGVVICNIYRRLDLVPLEIGRNKKKIFLKAYASLVSHFALIRKEYVYMLNATATKLYSRLEEQNLLSEVGDHNTLAAAIYHLSGISEPLLQKDVCAMFGANEEKYKILVGNENETL